MKPIYYILFALVFAICGFFVVTYAAGYKIDLTSRTISQTGMISVQADQDAKIFVNDEQKGVAKLTLRSVQPGTYTVKVTKPGYFDWNKTIEVDPGGAEIINDVIQFKQNPTVAEFTDTSTGLFKSLPDTDGLVVSSGTILQNGNFVTRFQTDVTGVCWYPDRRYVAFSADNKLKIIEIDGTNLIDLLDKKSTSPVLFVNSGRSVIYESDGKSFKADIR